MSRNRFFGGGGTKTKAVDPYAGTGYREIFKNFTDFLQPSVGGVSAYPGQIVPGVSPLQQAGFDVASGLTPIASGGQEYFGDVLGQTDPGQANRYLGMAEQGISGASQPFDPSSIINALQPGKDLALNTFFRDFMPRLKENIVGRAGTADAGALQKLAVQGGEDISLGLGAQAYPYLYGGQQNQLNRMQQGGNQFMNMAGMPGNILGQAGNIGMMGANLGSNLINAGGIQRGITGEQMGEGYNKWQFEQPWASPWFNAMGVLGGSAPQMDYIAQQQSPGFGAQLMPAIGNAMGGYFAGGGTLAGLGASLFGPGAAAGGAAAAAPTAAMLATALSDERMKKNVKPLENALERIRNIKAKTFNYISTPETRDAGIMAQELEKVLPEGVFEYKGIKYVKLGAVMALLVNAVNELNRRVETIGA